MCGKTICWNSILCGIFGVRFDSENLVVDAAKLKQSVEVLRHRGPDAQVVFADRGIGLAHARLSLVDVSSRSDQPFSDDSGRYVLVFNGEIYNFRALRAKLQKQGVMFNTTSDTEVVLHSLIRQGVDALAEFEGMFALAFIDRRDGSVLLARDRFGMKPLYWAHDSSEAPALLFASEVKALAPWMALKPDHGSLMSYLMKFGGPTSGRSFFEGVHSLGPGEYLLSKRGEKPVIAPFFKLPDFLDADESERLRGLSPTAVADEFDELMQNAVSSHLFADAKVGAFCSGGVDSSLIIAMAARQKQDVALFHANVKGDWSETGAARNLADHLGLEMHVAEVEEQDFVDLIPRVMKHYGYPFSYHPNCAPLMMTAQLAHDNGVKGLLSGEGSDELFLGYPWLGRKPITDAFGALNGGVKRAIRSVPGIGPILMPDHVGNSPQVRDLLNGREMARDMEDVEAALAGFPKHLREPAQQWTLDYMHHHLRTLLHRNDTMGMAASIEARFPFLDHKIARFGVNLPRKYKLRVSPFVFEKAHPFVRDKWVVRTVADRYVPKQLSQRIKIGFWTTVFQRLEISPAYNAGSPLRDVLKLSQVQLDRAFDDAGPDLKLRLLLTDVWLRTVIGEESEETAVSRLRDHVTIRQEGQKPVRNPGKSRSRLAASAPI